MQHSACDEFDGPSTSREGQSVPSPAWPEGQNGPPPSRGRRFVQVATGELSRARPGMWAVEFISTLLPQLNFNHLRTALWRSAGFDIGKGSQIMGELHLSGQGEWTSLFSVGQDTYITGPLRINFGGSVRIGSGVNIGHDCLLLTVDHEVGPPWRRAGWSTHLPIVIEDGVWIASRVTVLPGVTIGRGAVVAAGAVVATDVAPHTMVGGVPARVLRKLDPG
ncbi:MAG TPA: acyltransferase [Polyangiaceae bacterium]|nr:acyltransferase [Polyangiaceae bacterium]